MGVFGDILNTATDLIPGAGPIRALVQGKGLAGAAAHIIPGMGLYQDIAASHPQFVQSLMSGSAAANQSPYSAISQSRKSIRALASQLDPESQAQALSAIRVSRQLPLSQRTALLAQTQSALPQLVIQSAGSQAVLHQQQQQQQLGSQYLQQQLQSVIQDGKNQAAFTRGLISSVPAQFQGLMEARAQEQESYGQRLADAYLQQYQAQPIIDYYQRQLAAQGKSLNTNSGGSSASLQSTLPSGY